MKKLFFEFFTVTIISGFILGGAVNVLAQETKSENKLKFLVISEPKDIYYSMPANDRKKIDDAATENVKKAIKAGEFLEVYSIPGWDRSASIEEYDSIEQLYNHFERDPYYPYLNFEVYPLYETGEAEIAKPDAKKMRFLVICKPNDIWYAISEDERKKIEETTTSETGNFLEFYSIPGWYRYVAIEQYDSIESLYKHFEGDPNYPYADFEVYPLVETDLTQF